MQPLWQASDGHCRPTCINPQVKLSWYTGCVLSLLIELPMGTHDYLLGNSLFDGLQSCCKNCFWSFFVVVFKMFVMWHLFSQCPNPVITAHSGRDQKRLWICVWRSKCSMARREWVCDEWVDLRQMRFIRLRKPLGEEGASSWIEGNCSFSSGAHLEDVSVFFLNLWKSVICNEFPLELNTSSLKL